MQRIEYNDQKVEWVSSNGPPKDFHTLVRFTIITKLCKNANLHTRSFLSPDGEEIFVVVKSNEFILKQMAEKTK